jgi:hypothetical protein
VAETARTLDTTHDADADLALLDARLQELTRRVCPLCRGEKFAPHAPALCWRCKGRGYVEDEGDAGE